MLIQANAVHIPLKDESVDCVVTDPPYELGFMGKKWDSSGVAFQIETWKEIFRVMKPGAMMFCFGGTRTHHRLMCAIEDAGFEIRDCLMWLYGSGFPKSHDISKAIDKIKGVEGKIIGISPNDRPNSQIASGSGFNRALNRGQGHKTLNIVIPTTLEAQAWEGQGTALKPAYEPIILAMKPLDGAFAQNALKWGVAGLNIDACRIGAEIVSAHGGGKQGDRIYGMGQGFPPISAGSNKHQGRWPANVILDEEAAEMLDEQKPFTSQTGNRKDPLKGYHQPPGGEWFGRKDHDGSEYQDSGGASRFFYCAKASRSERNAGLEGMEGKQRDEGRKEGNPGGDNPRNRGVKKIQNYHPTVKPLALIEYLVKLGSRPSHIVLDPFVGSGTTCIACEKLNRIGIGLDLSWEYLSEIAAKRLSQPIQRELIGL